MSTEKEVLDLERSYIETERRFKQLPLPVRMKMQAHHRRSWVVGELLFRHFDMTKQEAEALYDRVTDNEPFDG
jgi:hypothetical protein